MNEGTSASAALLETNTALCDTARALEQLELRYLGRFPSAFSEGLFSAAPVEKSALLSEYASYVHDSLALLERLETTACRLAEVMRLADAELDADTVLRCDRLLGYRQCLLNERAPLYASAERFFAVKEKRLDALPLFRTVKALHAATLRFCLACEQTH